MSEREFDGRVADRHRRGHGHRQGLRRGSSPSGGARVVIADIDREAGAARPRERSMRGRRQGDLRAHRRVRHGRHGSDGRRGGRGLRRHRHPGQQRRPRASAARVDEIDEATWNTVMTTNLTSVWRGMRVCVPEMRKRGGGAIVNMSSVQSLAGFKGWAAYAAAKGGINALTQQAAVDLAPLGIRVNAVAPGTIMTPLNQKHLRHHRRSAGADRHLEQGASDRPLRRGAGGGRGGGCSWPATAPPSSPARSSASTAASSCGENEHGQQRYIASRRQASQSTSISASGTWRCIEVERDGRRTAPFHRAPWADDAAPPAGTEDAPHLARISGDFFCAPFVDVRRRGGAGAWLAGQRRLDASSTAVPSTGGGITATLRAGEAGHGRARAEGADAARRPSLPLSAPHLRRRRGRGAGRQPRHGQAADRRPHVLFAEALGGDADDAAGARSRNAGARSSPIPARSTDLTSFPRADGGTVDLTRLSDRPGS